MIDPEIRKEIEVILYLDVAEVALIIPGVVLVLKSVKVGIK